MNIAASLPGTYKQRFLIKAGTLFFSVPSKAIAYFETYKQTVRLVTLSGVVYEVGYNMAQLEGILDPVEFFRVSRSHLISYASFVKLDVLNESKTTLYLTPDPRKTIAIASARIAALKRWLDS